MEQQSSFKGSAFVQANTRSDLSTEKFGKALGRHLDSGAIPESVAIVGWIYFMRANGIVSKKNKVSVLAGCINLASKMYEDSEVPVLSIFKIQDLTGVERDVCKALHYSLLVSPEEYSEVKKQLSLK